MGMGYGMNFYSALPSNYQNGLYWTYLMQTMQQVQQMQQAQYERIRQSLQQQQQTNAQDSSAQNQTSAVQNPVQAQAPVDTVTSSQSQQTPEETVIPTTGDGNDDGKISFGKKCKNFVKGVGNFFKGMVCDENGKFSIKRTLTTAAVAAGAVALTVATGGAAAPFLVGAGVVMGAVQTGKGIKKAMEAKTDAQAEAAWQEIGSGATAIVGSVAGAKGALKTAKVNVSTYKGIKAPLQATRKTFEYSGTKIKDGYNYVKDNGVTNSATDAISTLNKNLKTNWEASFKSTNAKQNIKQYYETRFDKQIKTIADKEKSLHKELIELRKRPDKNAQIIEQKENQLKALIDTREQLQTQKAAMPEQAKVQDNNAKINQLTQEIDDLKLQKQTLSEADATSIDTQIAAKIEQRAKLIKQQSVAGVRELQIEELNTKIKNLKSDKNLSDEGKLQLTQAQDQLEMVKSFAKAERLIERINVAKARVQKLEKALKETNENIKQIENNSNLSTTQKLESIAGLELKQKRLTNLIEQNNSAIKSAKKRLHLKNAKLFEQQHRASIGYPTMALTGGNVTTLSTEDADALAQSYGFESAQAMQDYINAMNSSKQALNNADEFLSGQQTTASQSTDALSQRPAGSGLGFEELYASPYGSR